MMPHFNRLHCKQCQVSPPPPFLIPIYVPFIYLSLFIWPSLLAKILSVKYTVRKVRQLAILQKYNYSYCLWHLLVTIRQLCQNYKSNFIYLLHRLTYFRQLSWNHNPAFRYCMHVCLIKCYIWWFSIGGSSIFYSLIVKV